jgi:hypothetical protein
MKKLNLMTRAELKHVLGGVGFEEEIGGGPNCTDKCTSDSDCTGGDNNCKKCATGSILKGTCITSE